jgi:hypothetical protein
VRVKIGNRFYDAIREARCYTCMHPAREEIETQIIQGHSYKSVATQYSEVDWSQADGTTVHLPQVTWSSIMHHFKAGHMPVEAAAMRQIIEKRAESIGVAQYEGQVGQFVDQYTFAQQVVAQTQERMVKGEIRPEVRDGLAAAKLLQDIESASEGSLDSDAWGEAMERYFEVAQKMMPPDMWSQFIRALSTDPILQAIAKRLSTQQENVIDADIVEPNERD